MLRKLIDRTDVVPAVNQVELHPYFTEPALREIHAELGIVTRPGRRSRRPVYMPGSGDEARSPLTDPVITGVAAKYYRTRRRSYCAGTSSTASACDPQSPSSRTASLENFDVFDFSLEAGRSQAIDAPTRARARRPDPELLSPETYPKVVDNS